jgi:3-oxo-5-alpha-steroid 4-dehydrogenase 1
MVAQELFPYIVTGWTAVAAGVFVTLLFFTAPYGRYARREWGPVLGDKLGWILMEAPAPLAFAALYALGPNRPALTATVFFGLWEAHYVHRAFIYPFTRRGVEKRMSLAVVVSGVCFNGMNAWLNGIFLFHLSTPRPPSWLADPRFVAGLALFVAGFVANRWSDIQLRALRRPGESIYRIPRGGLFDLVSCPNYLGEIMEWVGWAVLTWSMAGASFAAWTIANLAPRARSNQHWYRQTFPDYPPGRRALVPYIW